MTSIIGTTAGLSSALFLWSLDHTTATFTRYPLLLYGLPATGILIACLSKYTGSAANQGTNAIIRVIQGNHEPVPLIMAPFILITTLLTHLFGGSAGREGTAVQMSGSLVDALVSRFGISQTERQQYLRAAAGAGFAAVFGTPLAGAMFGIELARVRKDMHLTCLLPTLLAALIGDFTCRLTGVGHAHYAHISLPTLTPGLVIWMTFIGIALGLLATVFIEGQHFLTQISIKTNIAWWICPLVGGIVLVGITQLLGTNAFNGLGLPLISDALSGLSIPPWTFAIKLAFTVITLGTGFKGGEVTPLFCIGALFGNAFASITGQDLKLFTGFGFVGLFAAAAKVPLTCWVLGLEVFGPGFALPALLVTGIAYIVSGRRSIYGAQWEVAKA